MGVKEVVKRWISKLEKDLNVKEKEENIRSEFIREFEIEPEIVYPNTAKREVEITDKDLIKTFINCYRAYGCDMDESEISKVKIVFEAKLADSKKLEISEWKLKVNHHGHFEYQKTRNGLMFRVEFKYELAGEV